MLDEEFEAAGKKGFKAVELPVRLKAHVESVVRPFQSRECGGDAAGTQCVEDGHKRRDQAVMYTAHYDHLGFVRGDGGRQYL